MTVVGGVDLAFRRNSCGLAVARRGHVTHIREWQPTGSPMRPSVVCGEIARECSDRGVTIVAADGHYVESLREALDVYGIALVDAPAVPYEAVEVLQLALAEGRQRIVAHERLRLQLESCRLTYESGGHTKVHLDTASDGSHGDLAAATFLAVWLADQSVDHGRMTSGRIDRGARLSGASPWTAESLAAALRR